MLSSARDHVERAPWLVTWPGLFILTTVMSINLLGDALRDAWDPRLRPSS
jgi:dipeptide transport system permease protein